MPKDSEQQVLTLLTEISKDIKTLIALISTMAMQQAKADTRASHQLSQIAHKR